MTTDAQPGAEPTAEKSSGRRAASLLKELVFVVVGALVVSTLLRAFVGQMFVIPSESMENTLLKGDRVVVQKITDFKRGDVVVFEDPGGWLGEESTEPMGPLDRALEFIGFPTKGSPEHLIKRVIGTAGDRVVCCDAQNRITVNGYALDERSYLYTGPDGVQVDPSTVKFSVLVPKDKIFVMGDHRDLSADSRCHLSDLSVDGRKGSVAFPPVSKVVGPAFAIAAPFARAKILQRPETFAGVPAPTSPAPENAEIKPADVTC